MYTDDSGTSTLYAIIIMINLNGLITFVAGRNFVNTNTTTKFVSYLSMFFNSDHNNYCCLTTIIMWYRL